MNIKVIAEAGINHNGDINIAKKLIDVAVDTGCNYIKFQKRNPDICVPENQKHLPKETPWGEMTYLQYKIKTELSKSDYDEIDAYCKKRDIKWFCSVWDIDSVEFMKNYCSITKIPSALIIDEKLCKEARKNNDTLIVSTGMSTENEIDEAIKYADPDIIMHTNSTYPSPINEINIKYINWLKDKYKDKIIGYSGHESGFIPTLYAVALGATFIERHITLDKSMWGSDQKASLEPTELESLVKHIREMEDCLGEGGPRTLLKSELEKKKSLRG